MPTPSTCRLLPGTPRWALAVVVLVGTAALIAPVLAPGAAPVAPIRFLPALAVNAGLCVVLAWRARSLPQERLVWERIALSAAVVTAAAVTTAVLALFPSTRPFAAVPLEWAPVAAFPFLYGGLVRWNRFGTNLADPNDVLNGSAAALAAVAVLDALLTATGSPLAAGPWWEVHALLGQVATGAVLLGTVLSVVALGGLGHDPRVWLVVGSVAVALCGDVGRLLNGGEQVPWLAGAAPLGAVLMAVAAVLRPGRSAPRPTDPTASTIGAFVVIVASTAVLLFGAVSDEAGAATWCAAVAATASSVRLLINVRELATLAVSRREALTDELTGLANRRAVLRRVEEASSEGLPLAFALLDLDKFKEVNDGLGHAAGDDLLRLVAERLQPVLRTGDLLGRLGGDEFAVVAVLDAGAAPTDAAEALGRRLLDRLREPFRIGGMSVHVSSSIGLAPCAGSPLAVAGTAELLLQQADAAMYAAKRAGTGQAVYDDAEHGDASRHLALVEELRSALSSGQLVLHHQPQVDVDTGRTVGVEALVRWAHPTRGLLGPAEFLPQAEVHGLMGLLTDEVLRQAITQAAAWRQDALDLRVSVNLSASNLLDTTLPCRVADLLREAGVPPEGLVLEVTESVLLSDPDRSLAVVRRLADLGVTVSIDDFGTGYSSLSYLRELPVAELKLDRSFTAGLLTDARTEAIVASTVALAHRLGLRVVAEGVESAETLTHLAALGCDESQGYLHAPPLPAGQLVQWLDEVALPVP